MSSLLPPFGFDPTRQLLGYLVRHGELRNMRIWDGWGDYRLSEEGIQQAEAAARWLSFDHIGRVVASDVPRAIQTAEIYMAVGNFECPMLSCEPNLRPWMVSDFTGKEKTPERVADFQKYIDDPDLQVPGGESRNQLTQRVQVAFQYLASPYKALPTILFIHNSVIKSLMGLEDVRDAVSPGGVVAVYMDEKGQISFQIMIGHPDMEKGVS